MEEKFFSFLIKSLSIILDRRLMALIGGISELLFIVFYYFVPSAFSFQGTLKYSILFGCVGAFGLIVHWGFAVDATIEKRKIRKKMIGAILNPKKDTAPILIAFFDQGEAAMNEWRYHPGINYLHQNGVLAERDLGMPKEMRAYSLTSEAAEYGSTDREKISSALSAYKAQS